MYHCMPLCDVFLFKQNKEREGKGNQSTQRHSMYLIFSFTVFLNSTLNFATKFSFFIEKMKPTG